MSAVIYYLFDTGAGETKTIQLRLSDISPIDHSNFEFPFGQKFNTIFAKQKQEADEFYQ